jgi:signal transduction histidine kinase
MRCARADEPVNPLRLLRSLTFRLALFYLALFMGSVGLLLGVAYWTGVASPLGRVQDRVGAEAAVLVGAYGQVPQAEFVRRLQARAAVPDLRPAYHALVAPDGAVIASNLPNWPAARAQRDWVRFEFESYASGDEVEHEAIARDVTFSDGVRLLVGRDTEDLDEREDFIRETIAWGTVFTIAIGFAGGLLMSLAVARRIETVTSTARRVIDGDLSGRVAVQGSGDDFDHLAEMLNQMLARIEDLVQSVSRVSDSIAHELRTPLTRLHADLEDLTRASRDDPETRRLAEQALGEAGRLQSTFDALLRIARIETGRHEASLHDVDLAGLLDDAVELYQPAAEARRQALVAEIARPLRLRGDPDLLFQAVSNLLDNAIKYTPEGGAIRLAARREGRALVLAVQDQGPGVAAEHQPHMTERFFRAPGVEGVAGLGLGLSLVAAVAKLHHAEIEVRNLEPGLSVALRFAPPVKE